MDISKAIEYGTRLVHIVRPGTDIKLGITVEVMSIKDPRMKSLKNQIMNERFRVEAKGKHLKADDVDDNLNAIAFKAMVGWEWSDDANWKGEIPVFNQRNAFEIFNEAEWFRAQIVEAIEDEEAFFVK